MTANEITVIAPLALSLLFLLGIPFFLKIYSRFEELYKIVTNRGSPSSGQTVNSSGEGNPDSGGDDAKKDKKKDSNKKSWFWSSVAIFLLGAGTLGAGLIIWYYKYHLPGLEEVYREVLEAQGKFGVAANSDNWADHKDDFMVDLQGKMNTFAEKSGVRLPLKEKAGVFSFLDVESLENIKKGCDALIEDKKQQDNTK